MTNRHNLMVYRIWTLAVGVGILHLVLFDIRILSSPVNLQVQYIPDDAFYYLGLARSFAQTGLWSFDSGFSHATGFHPLFAYLLAGIYWLFQPSDRTFVQIGLLVSGLTTLAFVLAILFSALRKKPTYEMLLLALMISASDFGLNSSVVMEWPFVLLAAFFYITYWRRHCLHASHKDFFILFLCGAFGSLSRSDFGLLPLSLFAAPLFLVLISNPVKNMPNVASDKVVGMKTVLFSISGLAGAIAGLALIFLQNYWISGQIFQSSALIKAHWAAVLGRSYGSVMKLFPKIFGLGSMNFWLVAILFLILGYLMLRSFTRNWILPVYSNTRSIRFLIGHCRYTIPRQYHVDVERDLVSVLGMIFCLGGYALFYINSSGIQRWYTANLIVPAFFLWSILLDYYDLSLGAKSQAILRLTSTVIVFCVAGAQIISLQRFDPAEAPWPHQQFMLEAGIYLKKHPIHGKIGSWNAGILGYFQGGEIINLDGLVNDGILDDIASNKVPTYLGEHKIEYVIDFQNMFADPNRRLRGGYDDPGFIQGLKAIQTFGHGEFYWKFLTLYEVSGE